MATFDPEDWVNPDTNDDLEPDAPLEVGSYPDGESVSVHSLSYSEAVTMLGTTFLGIAIVTCEAGVGVVAPRGRILDIVRCQRWKQSYEMWPPIWTCPLCRLYPS